MNYVLLIALLSPFVGAVLIGALDRFVSRRVVVLASLSLSLTSLAVARTHARVAGWSPDRLGLFLAVASLFIGLCVCHYAVRQFAGENRGRTFLAMALAIVGCVVSTDLSNAVWSLYVSWSATSIVTVLVLGVGGGARAHSALWRRAARSFVIGDVTLLIAFTSASAYSSGLSVFSSSNGHSHSVASVIVVTAAMVAAVARAGLTVRRSWVIDTVNAPTPVSALLHAGVVNAGALLIYRIQDVAGRSTALDLVLVTTCLAVLVILAPRIHARVDLKGQLAASTVAQMSLMLAALALGYPLLAFTHAVGHGLYKAGRFMSAGGAIDQRARLRRRRPSGTVVTLPWRTLGATTIVVVAATWGMIVGGDAPALMGVFGPAAVVVWWTRSATALRSVAAVWSGLILALLVYGALVAGLSQLVALDHGAAQWRAPWWSLGALVVTVVAANRWLHPNDGRRGDVDDSSVVRSSRDRIAVPS